MFTGIVEELGTVVAVDPAVDSARLAVRGGVVEGAEPGDSVAVNGVCLTVTEIRRDVFTADVMAETLRRTALGDLAVGAAVNLERPLTLSSRLGGHLVQGHVDAVGVVVDRVPGDRWEVVTVRLPDEVLPYVVSKGSVALDGVSLTVSAVDGGHISVSLIPETLARTTLGAHRPVGSRVNVEVDVIAKYVERLLAGRLERA